MDAVERASGHGEVPRQRGATGQHDRIEGSLDLGRRSHRDVGGAGRPDPAFLAGFRHARVRVVRATTDRSGAHEGDALRLHLGQAAVQDGLLILIWGTP